MSRLRWIFWMGVFFLCEQALFGQGCASCYTTAAAARQVAVRALRHGILILLFPPLVLFCGIVVAAIRRDRHRQCE